MQCFEPLSSFDIDIDGSPDQHGAHELMMLVGADFSSHRPRLLLLHSGQDGRETQQPLLRDTDTVPVDRSRGHGSSSSLA